MHNRTCAYFPKKSVFIILYERSNWRYENYLRGNRILMIKIKKKNLIKILPPNLFFSLLVVILLKQQSGHSAKSCYHNWIQWHIGNICLDKLTIVRSTEFVEKKFNTQLLGNNKKKIKTTIMEYVYKFWIGSTYSLSKIKKY